MAVSSSRVRTCDLRPVYLLIGECCELGADATLWRMHMLERLNQLFGAVASVDVVASADMTSTGPVAKVDLGLGVDRCSRAERDLLTHCMRNMPVQDNPLGSTLWQRQRPGQPMAATRRQCVPRQQWLSSAFYINYLQPLGWDDMICSMVIQPNAFRCFNFSRARGDREFPVKCAALLEAFLQELVKIPTTRLEPLSGNSLLDLPRRQLDVLMAMSDGDNEKQIAARLSIGRSTVHEYVRRLYGRFGVSSRSGLLLAAARRIHALKSAIATCDADDYWYFRGNGNGTNLHGRGDHGVT